MNKEMVWSIEMTVHACKNEQFVAGWAHISSIFSQFPSS